METMYQGLAFSPFTTLTGDISAADSVIPVADVSVFPDAPNYATIAGNDGIGETILYTAKTGSGLSGCTRGVEGVAKAWDAGEIISRNWTAADHRALIVNIQTLESMIPTSLSELAEDETHRTVTDSEKATWTAKSDFSGSYDDLTNKPSLFSGNYEDLTGKPDIPTSLSELTEDTTHRLVTDSDKSSWNEAATQAAAAMPKSGGTFSGTVKAAGEGYQDPSTYMLRNTRLASADTTPTVNGEICWTYG